MNISTVSSGCDPISLGVSSAKWFITQQLIGILNEFGPPLNGQDRFKSGGRQIPCGPKLMICDTGNKINRPWRTQIATPEAGVVGMLVMRSLSFWIVQLPENHRQSFKQDSEPSADQFHAWMGWTILDRLPNYCPVLTNRSFSKFRIPRHHFFRIRFLILAKALVMNLSLANTNAALIGIVLYGGGEEAMYGRPFWKKKKLGFSNLLSSTSKYRFLFFLFLVFLSSSLPFFQCCFPMLHATVKTCNVEGVI